MDQHVTEPLRPSLEYERAPCPRCGAVNVDEAETKCRPVRAINDEYECPADQEDDDGFFLFPTPASLATMDEWIEEQIVAADRAAHARNRAPDCLTDNPY